MSSKLKYADEDKNAFKKEIKEQRKELEDVYKRLENARAELANIYETYDLPNFDEKMKSAKRTEQWAEAFISELGQYVQTIEAYLTCAQCQRTIKKEKELPVMVLPC